MIDNTIDIHKPHLIPLNDEGYPFFNTIIDNMDAVRINVDLEVMKYELFEKIINNTNFKLDLDKKILYLDKHELLEDGFMLATNTEGSRHILHEKILIMQELCYSYRDIDTREFNAGEYITIEPMFFNNILC